MFLRINSLRRFSAEVASVLVWLRSVINVVYNATVYVGHPYMLRQFVARHCVTFSVTPSLVRMLSIDLYSIFILFTTNESSYVEITSLLRCGTTCRTMPVIRYADSWGFVHHKNSPAGSPAHCKYAGFFWNQYLCCNGCRSAQYTGAGSRFFSIDLMTVLSQDH